MYCNFCGGLMSQGQNICPNCGAYVGNVQQSYYNANNNYGQNNYNNVQTRAQPVLGMKWYNFLIWCELFLAALYNFVNGIRYITGSFYDGSAEYVYSYFSELKPYDICVGILAILYAIFGIITRFRLSGYKKMALRCFWFMQW